MNSHPDFYGWTPEQLANWALEQGQPSFRGTQVFRALHQQSPASFSAITALPLSLRERWDEIYSINLPQLLSEERSSDGTAKALLALSDGQEIECVSIPGPQRHSVCVSSQVGCAVRCSFCASGREGLARDLQAGEIVAQVLHYHRQRPVSHVVFMGSGEPLLNYAAVRAAIRVLCHPQGLGMSQRRITLSTVGVPEGIRQLARDEPQITLALSLHAPDDASRSALIPLNQRWNLADIQAALDDYRQLVGRRLTFEYILLADTNMAAEQAGALARLARRYQAHINLIPYNPVAADCQRSPSPEQIQEFLLQVQAAGGHATLRQRRGDAIAAACGQLRAAALRSATQRKSGS